MLKKIIYYLLIFIILITIGDYGINYSIAKSIDNKSPIYLSFASIGANSLESRMECWATIRKPSSAEELKKRLIQILNSLDLPADENKFVLFTDNNSILLNYLLAEADLQGYFCLETDLKKEETYLVISLVDSGNRRELTNNEKNLKLIPGVKWQFNYLYTADLDYMVTLDSHRALLEVISKILEVKVMNVYQQGNMTSMAGYSPVIMHKGQQSAINHEIYNFQAAIRNSSTDKKTYIYIGSPLILDDY